MGVGADDRGHAAIQEPAHADLLAGRLGVHVDEHVLGATLQGAQRRFDLDERLTPRAQEQVSRQVDHGQAHAVALDHATAVTGLGGEEVGRAQDALLLVEVAIDLAAAVGVVAQRDDVDALAQERVGDLGRDAHAAGGVLGVDDHEGGRQTLAQDRQQAQQRASPEASDEIADEQDGGRGAGAHGSYSRAPGRG